jgi:hypothetical protein
MEPARWTVQLVSIFVDEFSVTGIQTKCCYARVFQVAKRRNRRTPWNYVALQ